MNTIFYCAYLSTRALFSLDRSVSLFIVATTVSLRTSSWAYEQFSCLPCYIPSVRCSMQVEPVMNWTLGAYCHTNSYAEIPVSSAGGLAWGTSLGGRSPRKWNPMGRDLRQHCDPQEEVSSYDQSSLAPEKTQPAPELTFRLSSYDKFLLLSLPAHGAVWCSLDREGLRGILVINKTFVLSWTLRCGPVVPVPQRLRWEDCLCLRL